MHGEQFHQKACMCPSPGASPFNAALPFLPPSSLGTLYLMLSGPACSHPHSLGRETEARSRSCVSCAYCHRAEPLAGPQVSWAHMAGRESCWAPS